MFWPTNNIYIVPEQDKNKVMKEMAWVLHNSWSRLGPQKDEHPLLAIHFKIWTPQNIIVNCFTLCKTVIRGLILAQRVERSQLSFLSYIDCSCFSSCFICRYNVYGHYWLQWLIIFLLSTLISTVFLSS